MTTSINISSCLENPQSALRNAFVRRNVDGFKFALVSLQANPNYVDTSNGISIFEEILQTPNTSAFITLCIDNGADLYAKNSQGRYPLHYAVESLSAANLRAFLASYDRSKINVKYYENNSLHLIMELLPKLNKEEYEGAAECVKILIDYGCSVNMPNDKTRTPFNLLLRAQAKLRNKHELVDYIMEESKVTVDLYTYREKESVDLFKKHNPHHELPPRVDKDFDITYMEILIRNRKEEDFMADYQKFKEHVGKGSDENKSNNFREVLAQLLYRAVGCDCENIVQLLVDDGADVNAKLPSSITFNYSTLELACSRGNYKILAILLKTLPPEKLTAVSTEKRQNILSIITHHFGMDPSKNLNYSFEKCFEIAVEHCDKKLINQQDENGTTPLHYAAKNRREEIVLSLLRKGAYIGTQNIIGETPIDCMTHDTLEKYLDECITTKPRKFGDEEQEIIIDYSFLKSPIIAKGGDEFGPEIAPLQNISEHQELRPLIAHPVLASFLFLKWSKLSLLFHLNLLMFALFMVSLICYIVLGQTLTDKEQEESSMLALLKYLSMIGIFLLLIREVFQLILSPKNYFKSIINYFEIALIVLGLILISQKGDSDDTHVRILRAVTILFAAYEFLQLIGTLPYLSISTHMVILKKVALTFFKSLLLYSILILSFALCFFSLFGGAEKAEANENVAKNGTEAKDKDDDGAFNRFGYPGIAIIRTMVMLTGEFDAASLDLDKSGFYSIIFLLFVFLITIVLFNLLNALAIDDTQQIRDEGELVDFCERIKVLSKFEQNILYRSGSWQWLKKIISVFPYTIPLGKIVIRPDKNNEILTFKESSDVTINMDGEQELQSLNNNTSLKKLLPTSNKLEKYSKGMDGKIMKKIRKVFDERKQKKDEKAERLELKLSSMESEIKILKSSIQELTEVIRRNFEAK